MTNCNQRIQKLRWNINCFASSRPASSPSPSLFLSLSLWYHATISVLWRWLVGP